MKKIFTTVMVAISLFACSKQDEAPQIDSAMSVAINLNFGATRSDLGESVMDGVFTPLEDGVLYFYAANSTLVHTYILTAENIAAGACIGPPNLTELLLPSDSVTQCFSPESVKLLFDLNLFLLN